MASVAHDEPRFAEEIGIPRPNFDRHPFFLPFYGITEDEIDTPKSYQRYKEMAPITYLSADDPPALLDYGGPNVPVDKDSDLGLVVHHPLFGIALKAQMDNLGIECVVQYMDSTAGKKIRHKDQRPPLTTVLFIQEQFARAKQTRSSEKAKGVER